MHNTWKPCVLLLLPMKSVGREASSAMHLRENSEPLKTQGQDMGKSGTLKILHG